MSVSVLGGLLNSAATVPDPKLGHGKSLPFLLLRERTRVTRVIALDKRPPRLIG
jgi:hypothetical protein